MALSLTTTVADIPELSIIAEGTNRYREDCIVRNYVIARMYNDGVPESDIAAALGKDRATIRYAIRKHEQDLAVSEAYRAIVAALTLLQSQKVIHN